MDDGGSGAEFRLVRVVVAASPDGLADAAAAEEEEEEEAGILLASDANETRMGRARGSTVHFGRGLMGFFSRRGLSSYHLTIVVNLPIVTVSAAAMVCQPLTCGFVSS